MSCLSSMLPSEKIRRPSVLQKAKDTAVVEKSAKSRNKVLKLRSDEAKKATAAPKKSIKSGGDKAAPVIKKASDIIKRINRSDRDIQYSRKKSLRQIRQPRKDSSKECKEKFTQFIEDLKKRDDRIDIKNMGDKSFDINEEFEVEIVLDSRLRKQKLEYYVLWEEYPLEDCTWEPEERLSNAKEVIDKHNEMFPEHPGGPEYVPVGRAETKQD